MSVLVLPFLLFGESIQRARKDQSERDADAAAAAAAVVVVVKSLQ